MSADQDEVFSQWGCDRAVDWSTAALRCGMGRVCHGGGRDVGEKREGSRNSYGH